MMKHNILYPLLTATAILMAGCATQQTAPDSDAQAQEDLIRQSEQAVLWMQHSGEYAALAEQTFNAATTAFDHAKAARGKRKAVVVDLDETVLDNSPYAAWEIIHNQPFNDKTWTDWVNARQTRAIPGAVAFVNHVNSHGGTVFFVSNRKDKEEKQATMDDMRRLGFKGVLPERFYLKTDSSNKSARFDAIKAKGYDIVLMIGDNLNDFTGDTYHKDNAARRAFVASHANAFGRTLFMMPNPSYGDWMPGLGKDYYKITPQARVDLHKQALDAWSGK